MSKYDLYGIYELRRIAREKGVKYPTLYRRNDLIQQIQLIENGIIEPYVKKTKKGRPVKLVNIQKINYYECEQCPLLKKFDRILVELIDVINKNIKKN